MQILKCGWPFRCQLSQISRSFKCALAHRLDPWCLKPLVDGLEHFAALEEYTCHLEAADVLIGCDPEDDGTAEELRAELLRMCPSV